MSAKEIVKKFYKSDALIDSEVIKDFLHPDIIVEWNSSEGLVEYNYKSLFELGDKCRKNSNQIKNDLFNLGVTHGNEFGVPLSEVEKTLLNYDISLDEINNKLIIY